MEMFSVFKMTEQAGKSTEEMASAFIASTCRLLEKSSPILSDNMHNLVESSNLEPTEYSVLCGSAAEFYIIPPIKCIDDVDIAFARNNKLAFSGEFLVL